MKLKKFLIEFDNNDDWMRTVGVTAWTEEDALNLIRDNILSKKQLPDLKNIQEINSLDDLDQGHIIPNMDEFVSRGIWFPIGFKTRK